MKHHTALRALHKARGLTLAELGQRAGLTKAGMAALESGTQPKTWGRLQRIADALGTTTDAVLGRGAPPQLLLSSIEVQDCNLIAAMQRYAEQLLGPQLLRLAGGWRHIAEMAFLGTLYRIRAQDVERPDEKMPPTPADWHTGWESKIQRHRRITAAKARV